MKHGIVIVMLCLACQQDTGTPSPAPELGQNEKSLISHAVDIQPIWDESCTTGCHPGSDSMLSLEPDYAYKTMVGIPSVEVPLMDRVEPGDPDQSYLVHKIEDTHLSVGGMGFAMPSFSDLLGAEDIQLVRDWIDQGAAP